MWLQYFVDQKGETLLLLLNVALSHVPATAHNTTVLVFHGQLLLLVAIREKSQPLIVMWLFTCRSTLWAMRQTIIRFSRHFVPLSFVCRELSALYLIRFDYNFLIYPYNSFSERESLALSVRNNFPFFTEKNFIFCELQTSWYEYFPDRVMILKIWKSYIIMYIAVSWNILKHYCKGHGFKSRGLNFFQVLFPLLHKSGSLLQG